MYTPDSTQLHTASLDRRPTTLDYLRPSFFRLEFTNLPRTTYTCQVANIPELNIGAATQQAPIRDIPLIGDKLEYGDLNVEFILNEDMSNYIEIYNWILNIAGTDLVNMTTDDFRKALVGYPSTPNKPDLSRGLYADAQLYIINSSNRPVIKVNYLDVIPIAISVPTFDITNTNQDPMSARASFKYRIFNIEKL